MMSTIKMKQHLTWYEKSLRTSFLVLVFNIVAASWALLAKIGSQHFLRDLPWF